jgi:hypothetical protein
MEVRRQYNQMMQDPGQLRRWADFIEAEQKGMGKE